MSGSADSGSGVAVGSGVSVGGISEGDISAGVTVGSGWVAVGSGVAVADAVVGVASSWLLQATNISKAIGSRNVGNRCSMIFSNVLVPCASLRLSRGPLQRTSLENLSRGALQRADPGRGCLFYLLMWEIWAFYLKIVRHLGCSSSSHKNKRILGIREGLHKKPPFS